MGKGKAVLVGHFPTSPSALYLLDKPFVSGTRETIFFQALDLYMRLSNEINLRGVCASASRERLLICSECVGMLMKKRLLFSAEL